MKYFLKALFAAFLFIVTAWSENGNGREGDTTANAAENKIKREGDTTIKGIEFVLVKAGTFIMGSPKNESGRRIDENQFQVTLNYDYRISRYPVTLYQYETAIGDRPPSFNGMENNPVTDVTWNDADDFAKNMGGRLPTEAEWEFAARGGNKGPLYIYSGSDNLNDAGWYSGNIQTEGTQPTGQKQPNELGIYDMSGNVWEWCNDWYGSYPKGVVINPVGAASGIERVVRGGSWDGSAQDCRVANRGSYYPSAGYKNTGFRVVLPAN
jgi:formylglycine-generating enzyme required for sulfatase activity